MVESLVAHNDGRMDERMLKLVRMQASFAAPCPFCIDLNSFQYEALGISPAELRALQELEPPEQVPSFSQRERLAIRYAWLVSQTPLRFPPDFIEELKQHFNEREIIMASTAAQVNY